MINVTKIVKFAIAHKTRCVETHLDSQTERLLFISFRFVNSFRNFPGLI